VSDTGRLSIVLVYQDLRPLKEIACEWQ